MTRGDNAHLSGQPELKLQFKKSASFCSPNMAENFDLFGFLNCFLKGLFQGETNFCSVAALLNAATARDD